MTAIGSEHPLLVRRGAVVDGTGRDAARADVRVRSGVITEVGADLKLDAGEREIDAEGAVVAPGFIDPHTHLDPSIWWDPASDPNPLHGVTTAVTGNCSISLAPIRAEHRSQMIDMFAYIEDLPTEAIASGVPWTWETWPEYSAASNAVGSALNIVPLVGHSNLRLYVMGPDSFERPATVAEQEQMCGVLGEALEDGAFGLSLSFIDRDRSGRPVPSRAAAVEEYAALAKTLRRHECVLMFVPTIATPEETVRDVEFVAAVCEPIGLRATWAPLLAPRNNPQSALDLLRHARALRERGVQMYPQVNPRTYDVSVNMNMTLQFLYMPAWNRLVQARGQDKLSLLRSADWRANARHDWDTGGGGLFPTDNIEQIRLVRAGGGAASELSGMTLRSIVDSRRGHASDVLADLVLDSQGDIGLVFEGFMNSDTSVVDDLLADDATLVGASDAGAHVLTICGAGDTTDLIIKSRDRGVMSLEAAIRKLTLDPAAFFGIPDRGQIKVGYAADLVVFDPSELSLEPSYVAYDIPPSNVGRLTRKGGGYRYTIVGGSVVQENGSMTAERPGRMLSRHGRSGRVDH